MENVFSSRLKTMELGGAQTYGSITILPVVATESGRFQYRTLAAACACGDLVIAEVSVAGSIAELMATNRGQEPVLLLDGEELAGAKQNRVLNSSVLLRENSETKVPVSCTEQGRWAYLSKTLCESGNVMACKSRSRKSRSVHRSLQRSAAHASDQGEVWDGIAELQAKAGMRSSTSAMQDVFQAQAKELRRCEAIFRLLRNQVGLLAFVAGQLVGMDVISLESAYYHLHPKLVRSYALEGLLNSGQRPAPPEVIASQACEFLRDITTTEPQPFQSVGYGTDYRYQAKNLVGTALVHENEVIHAAFFRLNDHEYADHMTSCHSRRHRFNQ